MNHQFKVHPLCELVDVLPGYQARGRLKDDPSGSCLVIQGKDIVSDGLAFMLRLQTEHLLSRIQPTGKFKKYLLAPDDILFQARGSENRAFFVGEIEPNTLAAATFYILRKKNNHPIMMPWLAWYINQSPMQQAFRKAASGTSVSYVKRSTLSELLVPLPPLKVQKKIFNTQVLWIYEQEQHQLYLQKKNQLIHKVCLEASIYHQENRD